MRDGGNFSNLPFSYHDFFLRPHGITSPGFTASRPSTAKCTTTTTAASALASFCALIAAGHQLAGLLALARAISHYFGARHGPILLFVDVISRFVDDASSPFKIMLDGFSAIAALCQPAPPRQIFPRRRRRHARPDAPRHFSHTVRLPSPAPAASHYQRARHADFALASGFHATAGAAMRAFCHPLADKARCCARRGAAFRGWRYRCDDVSGPAAAAMVAPGADID